MGPSDHCSIQDNCIDNIFFFGGKRFGGSNPSLQVDYLKLSSTSQKGNYVVLKYSAQLILWVWLKYKKTDDYCFTIYRG